MNEMGETEFAPPSTFGSQTTTYGDTLARCLPPQYLATVLKAPPSGLWSRDDARATAGRMKAEERVWRKEVKETVERMGRVGQRYEGGKVEALLG